RRVLPAPIRSVAPVALTRLLISLRSLFPIAPVLLRALLSASMAVIIVTCSGKSDMQLGLTGKVALITGGTSGIGLAIAQTLAAEGCRVAICGRDKAKLDKAVAAIKSPNAKGFIADVCKPGDVA